MPHIYSPRFVPIRRLLTIARHITRRMMHRTKHDILAGISFQYQQSSTLLTIPAEIRLLIYSLVFTYPDLVNSLHTHPDPKTYMPTQQLLQPLLTCRQIYTEANILAFKLVTFNYRLQMDTREPKISPSILSKTKADAVRSLTIIDDSLQCSFRHCHMSNSWYGRLFCFKPLRIGLEMLEEIIVHPEPMIREAKHTYKTYCWYQPYFNGDAENLVASVVLAFMWNIPTLKRLILCDINVSDPANMIDDIMKCVKLKIPSLYLCSLSEGASWARYAQWVKGLQRTWAEVPAERRLRRRRRLAFLRLSGYLNFVGVSAGGLSEAKRFRPEQYQDSSRQPGNLQKTIMIPTAIMGLLCLPTELLFSILRHAGPEFFQEDHERLTVCKRWYSVARNVFYESLHISVNDLPGLLYSGGKDERLKILKNNLRSLAIELRTPEEMEQRFPHVVASHPEFKSWSASMNSDLAAIGDLLQSSNTLQELHLTRHTEERCLSLTSVSGLLRAKRLVVLELDTSVSLPEDTHICPLVGSLLHSLRVLRLRMRNICPAVLRLTDNDDGTTMTAIPLKKLIVNLAAHNMITCDSLNSRRCDAAEHQDSDLVEDFRQEARQLAARMVNPIEITLVYRNAGIQIRSVNIVTRKRKQMSIFGTWEDAN